MTLIGSSQSLTDFLGMLLSLSFALLIALISTLGEVVLPLLVSLDLRLVKPCLYSPVVQALEHLLMLRAPKHHLLPFLLLVTGGLFFEAALHQSLKHLKYFLNEAFHPVPLPYRLLQVEALISHHREKSLVNLVLPPLSQHLITLVNPQVHLMMLFLMIGLFELKKLILAQKQNQNLINFLSSVYNNKQRMLSLITTLK